MDQHTQRFGLISGHLRRLVESAGWGEVPKASCSSTAHLPVGRKQFSAQLAYHGGDKRCCSRRWDGRHLFVPLLLLILYLNALQRGWQPLWTGLSAPSPGVVRALPEIQAHASSAGGAAGEVPGVRS